MVSEESIFQHQRRVVLKLQKGLVKMIVLFNHFVMVKAECADLFAASKCIIRLLGNF